MRRTPARTRADLLRDLITWGERLQQHVEQVTEARFLADTRSQDAACRCIEVIGEAARRLMEVDPTLLAEHPGLELRQAYAARNRLEQVPFRWTHLNGCLALENIIARAGYLR